MEVGSLHSEDAELLLATSNLNKVREYLLLLKGIPFIMTTLAQANIKDQAPETGVTFEENASAKARFYADLSRLLTLAEDSGLEVEALGGKPGPLSRRYAGEGASDEERIRYLLSRIKGVPRDKRKARFRCVIAIVTPNGKIELCQGECRGYIALEPKGNGGFGYDPVFLLPEQGQTMAELSLEEKNQVSHRGQAAQKAREALARLAREGF